MTVSSILRQRRVAVLDDDIKFIRLVERVLRQEQIEVFGVTSLDLDEAVRVVAETECSAALVDIYMYGDAAGFRVIEKLRASARTASLPLVVTSSAEREVARRVDFLRNHQCTVLLKPFEIDALVAKMRSIGFEAPAPPAMRQVAAPHLQANGVVARGNALGAAEAQPGAVA